jgi:hypothetical protein
VRLTHSPIRGNGILEADPCVPQSIDHELGAADRVIGSTRTLHILPCRLGADPENPRYRLDLRRRL